VLLLPNFQRTLNIDLLFFFTSFPSPQIVLSNVVTRLNPFSSILLSALFFFFSHPVFVSGCKGKSFF
jgi:hypothetical protein